MMEDRKQRRVSFLISAALVIATLAAYEPMRHNDFVNYDDPGYVKDNPHITGGLTSESVTWAFTKIHALNWHPLTTLSHILDCEIFGLNPFGHHLVSLLFHIAGALLLFWLLADVTGSTWASAFVAGVFALHPLQVESVAWVAERKTVVSGLFWFLTTAVYIWYTKRAGIGRYILLCVVYGLCIMTKPIVVTLPLVLLLLDYWPLERFSKHPQEGLPGQRIAPSQRITGAGGTGGAKYLQAGRLLIEKVPLLAMSAILCVVTFINQGSVIIVGKVPLVYRVANAFFSYIRYIGKTIWPSRLAVFYPFPDAHTLKTTAVFCAVLFVLITVLCIYVGRRRKYIIVGWLWFAGTLVPMAGLVKVGSQAIADRYMYVSILGLLIIAAWGVKDLVANRPVGKVIATVSAMCLLLSGVILTRMQVRYWKDSIALFEHTLKVTANNASAENSYGNALLEAGRFDEAQLHLSNAVRLCPSSLSAQVDIGRVLLKQEKTDEAIACLNGLLQQGGDTADVHYYLAFALGMQEKYDEAIKHLGAVLKLDPEYPDARSKMGIALLATGKPKEAIEYLKEALRTDKDQWRVYKNLGIAYYQSGMYESAIGNLTRAVELKPDSSEALSDLSWAISTSDNISAQDADKAVQIAQRACELTGYKEYDPLDALAAAYAAAGRFDDAVKTVRQAVEAAKAAGRESAAGEIQKRLGLYQAGQRYRQK